MSRPFSYHDENLDVIGNILFVHVHVLKEVSSYEKIFEVPPEILKRIYDRYNVAVVTGFGTSAYNTSVDIVSGDFVVASTVLEKIDEQTWLYCWYPLKDI